ncbi:Hypothetical protein, putative [Bodo saltans]|uniref:Uncharacterized protein n=1 Tax=Bodo saltans TaxID=75058 RepID=A0A0S4JPM2_BODSA|nr:Hypothetical protein, putative [Bodo saltans]|eukprot:CUG91233.1 Hypothetical protein, putative [Bodo saltans]
MDSMMDSRFLRGGADVMSEERDSLKMVLHDRNFANPIRGVLEAAFPARPVPRCTGQTASNSSTAGAE